MRTRLLEDPDGWLHCSCCGGDGLTARTCTVCSLATRPTIPWLRLAHQLRVSRVLRWLPWHPWLLRLGAEWWLRRQVLLRLRLRLGLWLRLRLWLWLRQRCIWRCPGRDHRLAILWDARLRQWSPQVMRRHPRLGCELCVWVWIRRRRLVTQGSKGRLRLIRWQSSRH